MQAPIDDLRFTLVVEQVSAHRTPSMESVDKDHARARERMVSDQIAARGIADPAVLEAFRSVPREAFVEAELIESAYEDSPLPIGNEQTISQPYIVASMAAALRLKSSDRVLEIGAGSGYAAAILARIAAEVFTVERQEPLAIACQARLTKLGVSNVHVRYGDGTLGWSEHAPYDAIVVAAGGPELPKSLLEQLALDGRLVIPIGSSPTTQELVRVTRKGEHEFARETLEPVHFVPLIGAEGWRENARGVLESLPRAGSSDRTIAELVREVAEPLESIEEGDVAAVLDRIGEARIVLLGEATHGTSEFYSMRARLSRELITQRGFDLVAVEADWPDAACIRRYIRPRDQQSIPPWQAFSRFPTWMWRNRETLAFVEWLRAYNAEQPSRPVGFFGLDLYSLYTSIRVVLDYLDRTDPEVARIARERYGCLMPFEDSPERYGRAAITGKYRNCEREAVAMLSDLIGKRLDADRGDDSGFLDAVLNAHLVANAERYYRAMYYGSNESWNLRDQHMFDTLEGLLAFHGPDSKAIVWEHNSHVGNAAATEMGEQGQTNVGLLCQQAHDGEVYAIGFGTDHGTVAVAHDWDEPMQLLSVVPALGGSYENLFHQSKIAAFCLPLSHPAREEVVAELASERLERAIGVVYRPESERASHYFHASLPRQFDEYIWFDRTRAIDAISDAQARGFARGHPFARW